MKLTLPSLYYVTDHDLTAGRSQFEILDAALRGGLRLVQWRDKKLDDDAFIETGRELCKLSKKFGAIFLVDDRVEACLQIGADGVHLGQDDMHPEKARTILGSNAIIGLSTHNVEEMEAAQSLPIDYINIGPMYPTKTKNTHRYPPLGSETVVNLAKQSRIPVTTMGGIKKHHLKTLFSAGIQTVAMVSEISLAENVEQKVKELLREIESP